MIAANSGEFVVYDPDGIEIGRVAVAATFNNQIKFVIASRRDFDWAAEVIREHDLERRLTVLLSPVFSAVQPLELAGWLLESGLQVRMQLQLHKYVWDPKARGV